MAKNDGGPEIKFVCLEEIKEGNQYFILFTKGSDPTMVARVIGWAETTWQAQVILYGTNKADAMLAEREKGEGQ